jgi:hypothetical protein
VIVSTVGSVDVIRRCRVGLVRVGSARNVIVAVVAARTGPSVTVGTIWPIMIASYRRPLGHQADSHPDDPELLDLFALFAIDPLFETAPYGDDVADPNSLRNPAADLTERVQFKAFLTASIVCDVNFQHDSLAATRPKRPFRNPAHQHNVVHHCIVPQTD